MDGDDDNSASQSRDIHVWREATTMVLYLSIVLLATFTALPTGADADGAGHGSEGVHGIGLIGLIWGTALGLALAHWFSFRLTARAFGGGKVSESDVKAGLAQMGAAVAVAALCSVPVVVVNDSTDVQIASWVPALIVGFAGAAIARVSGRSRLQALVSGAAVLLLGLAVATVKNFLLGH